MRVQDLQEFLSKFTEAKSDGSRQGNAISNAIIMVEVNGYLEKITKMEETFHPKNMFLDYLHFYAGGWYLQIFYGINVNILIPQIIFLTM